jgi:hypothetical protein
MGGFLDLESPPTSKTKSNKGNHQLKWTVHQFRSTRTKDASAQTRKRESQNGEVTPSMCWDCSQDDHGGFRQLRDSSSAPPGPALKCWPLFFWDNKLAPKRTLGRAREQSSISGLRRFEQSPDKAALSFLFPRTEM